MKVLVIGNSTRSVACSAKRAGYTVYSIDRFGDVDMRRCADKAGFFKGIPDKKIYEVSHSFGEFDAVVLLPGFEKLKFNNVLNNRLGVLDEVNDKLKLAKMLNGLDIPHPKTVQLAEASGLGFPLMVKPRSGSGGMRNVLVRDVEDLASFMKRNDANEFLAQEYLEGIPCSASLIGNGDDARVVALNEQLIGVPWLTRLPFAYCGNITPFHCGFDEEMIQYATRIARKFRLVGSNGVDFIITDKRLYVLEVNPRFQGSLDTIELSLGINIFDAHVRSFDGELPEPVEPACFAAKAIAYANEKVVINDKISERLNKCLGQGRAADIPQKGWVVSPDEPVATFLETGKTRKIAFEKADKSAQYIKSMMQRNPRCSKSIKY